MDHDVLAEKCHKAFGSRIPMAARESWGAFIRERRTEFFFRWEWIKEPRFFSWVHQNSGPGKPLDISDGEEWFGVYIVTN